jgi:hypothetical protein
MEHPATGIATRGQIDPGSVPAPRCKFVAQFLAWLRGRLAREGRGRRDTGWVAQGARVLVGETMRRGLPFETSVPY